MKPNNEALLVSTKSAKVVRWKLKLAVGAYCYPPDCQFATLNALHRAPEMESILVGRITIRPYEYLIQAYVKNW